MDQFIADLKDAVGEAKLSPSGQGTMVVLYGACYLPRVVEVVRRQPAKLTRLLLSRVVHAHMQDSASRAPLGRRWSAASRRLSWIRYTRRSVAIAVTILRGTLSGVRCAHVLYSPLLDMECNSVPLAPLSLDSGCSFKRVSTYSCARSRWGTLLKG